MQFENHGKGPAGNRRLAEDKILAFDTLFTTNQIQKLKIVMPFLDNQMQKKMAVYIKFMELQYTISYFIRHPYRLCGCFEQESPGNFSALCHSLMAYSDRNEKRQMDQFLGIFQTMETYREMSQTMEMMKDFMPDMNSFGFGGDGGPGSWFSDGGLGSWFSNGGFSSSGEDVVRKENDTDREKIVREFDGDGVKEVIREFDGDGVKEVIREFDGDGAKEVIREFDGGKEAGSGGESGNNDGFGGMFGGGGFGNGGGNMMNMLLSMLTPEQMQMFEMFGGNEIE